MTGGQFFLHLPRKHNSASESKLDQMKAMTNWISRIILLFAICAIAQVSYGQFNIKVGYASNYVQFEEVDDLFTRYNAEFMSSSDLKAARLLHGIEFGARYMFGETVGLDFAVSSTKSKSEALGVLETPDLSVDTEWKIGLLNYSLGLENHHGPFGYGASIGYQRIKFSNSKTPTRQDVEVVSQSALASKFYLIMEASSKNIAFSFRPYISVNWDAYDVSDVQRQLFPGDATPVTGIASDPLIFGISILFYNGPQ